MLPFLRGDVRQEPAPGPRLGAGAALVAQRSAPGTAARGGYGSSRALGPLLGPGTRPRLGLALPLPGQSQETASGWAWLKSRRAQSWGRAQRWRGGLQKKPPSGCCALPPCRRRASGRNPSEAGLEGGQGAGACRCVGLLGSGGTGRSPPGAVPQPQVLHEILALQVPMAAAASWQRYGGGTAWCLPPEQTLGTGRGNHRSQELHHRQGSCQGISGRAVPSSSRGCSWPIRSWGCACSAEDPG